MRYFLFGFICPMMMAFNNCSGQKFSSQLTRLSSDSANNTFGDHTPFRPIPSSENCILKQLSVAEINVGESLQYSLILSSGLKNPEYTCNQGQGWNALPYTNPETVQIIPNMPEGRFVCKVRARYVADVDRAQDCAGVINLVVSSAQVSHTGGSTSSDVVLPPTPTPTPDASAETYVRQAEIGSDLCLNTNSESCAGLKEMYRAADLKVTSSTDVDLDLVRTFGVSQLCSIGKGGPDNNSLVLQDMFFNKDADGNPSRENPLRSPHYPISIWAQTRAGYANRLIFPIPKGASFARISIQSTDFGDTSFGAKYGPKTDVSLPLIVNTSKYVSPSIFPLTYDKYGFSSSKPNDRDDLIVQAWIMNIVTSHPNYIPSTESYVLLSSVSMYIAIDKTKFSDYYSWLERKLGVRCP